MNITLVEALGAVSLLVGVLLSCWGLIQKIKEPTTERFLKQDERITKVEALLEEHVRQFEKIGGYLDHDKQRIDEVEKSSVVFAKAIWILVKRFDAQNGGKDPEVRKTLEELENYFVGR